MKIVAFRVEPDELPRPRALDEQTARLIQRSGVEAAVDAALNAGRLQIDLQAPMRLVSARQAGRLLS